MTGRPSSMAPRSRRRPSGTVRRPGRHGRRRGAGRAGARARAGPGRRRGRGRSSRSRRWRPPRRSGRRRRRRARRRPAGRPGSSPSHSTPSTRQAARQAVGATTRRAPWRAQVSAIARRTSGTRAAHDLGAVVGHPLGEELTADGPPGRGPEPVGVGRPVAARAVPALGLARRDVAQRGADPPEDVLPGRAHARPLPRSRSAHQARNDCAGGAWRSRTAVQPFSGPGSRRSMRPSRVSGHAPRRAAVCAASKRRA